MSGSLTRVHTKVEWLMVRPSTEAAISASWNCGQKSGGKTAQRLSRGSNLGAAWQERLHPGRGCTRQAGQLRQHGKAVQHPPTDTQRPPLPTCGFHSSG